MLGLVSIARVHRTALEAPETHITRTPSRVPEIPIYGMGYNDRSGRVRCFFDACPAVLAHQACECERVMGAPVCVVRLGVKPLCTHETDKRGMVDCVPRTAAGLSGGSDWSAGLNLGNNIAGGNGGVASAGAGSGFCQQTCIQCSNGLLAGPGCDNCLCGVNSDYYRDGTAPDNCNQVCYYCRTSMMSGYECDSCSCGHWPAPLTHDPLENSWY